MECVEMNYRKPHQNKITSLDLKEGNFKELLSVSAAFFECTVHIIKMQEICVSFSFERIWIELTEGYLNIASVFYHCGINGREKNDTVLHMVVLDNCGETALKLTGSVEWLPLNTISDEHKHIWNGSWQGEVRQDSVFELANLLPNPRGFILTTRGSGWPVLGLNGHLSSEVGTGL